MAIHPAFLTSPYEVLNPEHRWFPADEDLRESAHDKLEPPFGEKMRSEVKTWRENQYERARGWRAAGASRDLLQRSTSGMKEKISAMSAQVKAILLERFSGAEVGGMADQLDDELQERFGGRKFNGD